MAYIGKEFKKQCISCLTLCDTMDCSPPGSSVLGILQTRILECIAVPFSRRSSQPRDWTQVSCIAGGFFTSWATREAMCICMYVYKCVYIERERESARESKRERERDDSLCCTPETNTFGYVRSLLCLGFYSFFAFWKTRCSRLIL